jgi:hypothetical protein
MNTQEAYSAGVKAAENTIKTVFENIIRNQDDGIPFPDPHMEAIRQCVKEYSDYYYSIAKRCNNTGKGFKKKIETMTDAIELSKNHTV